MKERTRKEIPIELPPQFYEEALGLRNKLLMYRFKNRAKIKKISGKACDCADFFGLPDRMQQAARPISAIVGDHPDLQKLLERFLRDKAKSLVLEASETLEGQIVKQLAYTEPEPNRDDVLIWELTFGNITERIKSDTGDNKLKTAQVRSKSNSLGLKTSRITAEGKQQRFVTCDKLLFGRLKSRYIPQDDPDDPDDRGGRVKDLRDTPVMETSLSNYNYNTDKESANSQAPPLDCLDRLDRLGDDAAKLSKICDREVNVIHYGPKRRIASLYFLADAGLYKKDDVAGV